MAIHAPAAQPLPDNPIVPPGMTPLVFDQFQGINTTVTRPGVKDEQMAWCDGFMPLGPNYLRTLYGIGAALWTCPIGKTIELFSFNNIGSTPYNISVLSDGSIYAINVTTQVATKIADAGTITSPVSTSVGINQYGSTYIQIVAKQTNGYFVWDGTLFYQAGTIGPQVTVTDGGSGYDAGATAATSGGTGSGATFDVTTVGGVVTAITVTDPGSGWLAGEAPTLTISAVSGGSGATATIVIMPFAVGGTAVETYSGHTWVVNGSLLQWTAPGSVFDFSGANGGGNLISSESSLRVQFTQLIATNGFLYLIADSSVSYISGVVTAGVPPVTSFSIQNVDPEVGTIWPDAVDVFGRNIVFINSFGAHVSYGGAVTKISEPLDGVYNSVNLDALGSFTPSAAKANIFGKKVWMFLLPIIDPISNVQTNKLFMWNGKLWWASSQDLELTFIGHQEINSELTAWGTNGTSIYQLFATPSIAISKVVQSKLFANGGIFIGKTASRLWVLSQYFSLGNPNLIVSIDNERGVSQQVVSLPPTVMNWTTVGGLPMVWTTVGGSPMTWFIAGINPYDPIAVGQQGVLLGLTARTNCDDMALISTVFSSEIVTYLG